MAFLSTLTKFITLVVVLVAILYGALLYSGPFDPWICRLSGRTLMCPEYSVNGTTAKGWESVRDAFTQQFKNGFNLGGQLVIWKDNELVIDLVGNYGTPNYTADSIQIMFSSTKVLEAIVIAKLVDDGHIDYYEPVAKYWPEFGQFGKENITVAEVLRHEGGLDVFSTGPMSWKLFLNQHDPPGALFKVIANSKPSWPPKGSKRSYHGLTRGLILNGLVHHADPKQRSIGKIFEEEFRKPLDLDCWIGLPRSQLSQVSSVVEAPTAYAMVHLLIPFYLGTINPKLAETLKIFLDPDPWVKGRGVAITGPNNETQLTASWLTSPEALYTESPSSNGVCNARSLGTVLNIIANSGTLNGRKFLSSETIQKMHKISTPPLRDNLIGINTTFTDGGVAKNLMFKEGEWFGWAGWGGSVAQYDIQNKMVYAYVMTGMSTELFDDSRTGAVFKEVKKIVYK